MKKKMKSDFFPSVVKSSIALMSCFSFFYSDPVPDCEIIITSLEKDEIEVRWGECLDGDSLNTLEKIVICPSPVDEDYPNNITISDFDTRDRVYTFEGLRAAKKYSVFLRNKDDKIVDTATRYTSKLHQ